MPACKPLATLGTFILWLGWFGFNGGSELIVSNVVEANAVSKIFVNTNLATGGVMGALLVSKILFGKSDLTMALNGAIAGLVSITAEPLHQQLALPATIIGAVGGLLVVFSIIALDRMKLDDLFGGISAHGTAGIWGLLAVVFTAEHYQHSYTE